ncbi:response regulator transcription factor [Halobacillus salinarum]|uniref:Response regulator transcription factor n=1 Tax=Halobacillus salinarum TaxID=2932257 RepID=A0ABY4EID9_9BACI|nr:response regulator transcription factor [Halobacillus salinarum]UOQ44258.1 response regulator transcription factor [Halobacillus salinarum]
MIRVMVVDDHAVLRDGIVHVINLEENMKVVGEASGGEEVKAKAAHAKPDVIVMDIHLQEECGVDITAYLQAHHPEIKVLMLTVADEDHYLQRSLDAGAAGYLLKEMTSKELVYGIVNVWKGHCVIPPSMTKNLLKNYKNRRDSYTGDHPLTHREKEVLMELTKGLSNKEIARTLFISDKTVKIHIRNIYKKLEVKSRSQVMLYAIQKKLIPPMNA